MMRNPVFESSMTRRARSYRAPLLVTLYVAFLLLVSGVALYTLQSPRLTLGNLRAGIETHIYVSVMQFALIILVAPALTAGSIAGERERQTLDLLLCTRVGSASIVLGKLFSSVCFLGLMLISSLPILMLPLFFGGVAIGDILVMLLFLLVTAIACCSIGVFCSAVFKRTVTATVMAYLIVFGLGVGTIIVPLIFQLNQIALLADTVSYSSSSSTAYLLSSSSVGIIGGSSGGTAAATTASIGQVLNLVPKLLFLNPGVGLASLLVTQTGLLQRTFSGMGYYQFSELYSLLTYAQPLAWVNMIVLMVVSAVLMGISVLFIKPAGRKAKKKA